ncbi:hypothetical protein ACQ4P5_14435 [Ralstonia sp. L16]|uniref:hypothetical protein n=1 Tax=Ralstonia sp. L16 TaxID=3423950 RepID=UPI003F79E5DA
MANIDYRAHALAAAEQSESNLQIARRLYLSYPTFAFSECPEREFNLKNLISEQYKVDIFSIHFCGSGKTGESYHKNSEFTPGKSDLDAAIISPSLFLGYLETASEATEEFKDRTRFSSIEEYKRFVGYLQRGILVPSLMPTCKEKIEWLAFFNNISAGYTDLFDNINCWIYSTQKVFEMKFSRTVSLIKPNDKIPS